MDIFNLFLSSLFLFLSPLPSPLTYSDILLHFTSDIFNLFLLFLSPLPLFPLPLSLPLYPLP